jgi:succinate dehydrogenase assembly factor 1
VHRPARRPPGALPLTDAGSKRLVIQENRTGYVRAKVRREYETHRLEADPEKVTFLLRLAETQLDQVREQARHLAEVFSDPGVHARF